MSNTRRQFLQSAALAALPRMARGASRPNILFFFPDQHRYDWTGINPKIPVRTPNLNYLAAHGVSFNRAVVASPLCAPSRACLASGTEYDRCGTPGNDADYPIGKPTYYGLLRDSGYHVAGCGKFDLAKKEHNQGLDGKRHLAEWGFSDGINNAGKQDAVRDAKQPRDPYMHYLEQRGLLEMHVADFRKRKGYDKTFPTPLPEDAYCDNWLAENGVKLLAEAPKGKPWHLVLNFTGPHPPMDITVRMEKLCRGRDFPQPNHNTKFPPQTHVSIRQNYSAMIENIDRWLGNFLELLKKRGELENTIIVWSSDHGEMLGDHDMWGKTKPFQPSVGVPLVAMGPGIAQHVASDALVSTIDLAATYLDFAGVATPKAMDARSLRRLLEGRAKTHREYVLSGLGTWRMVCGERYKLIRGFGAEGQGKAKKKSVLLYDMQADPLENADIAETKPGEAARLEKLLG